jgi:hypothetical protein
MNVLDALDESGHAVRGSRWVRIAHRLGGTVRKPSITIMIINAIRNGEVMEEDMVRGMVKVMAKNVERELND